MFVPRRFALFDCLLIVLTALSSAFFGGPSWAEVHNARGVAVIIGNSNYEHRDVPDVTFAHRDAEAFKRYVLDVLGFDPKNVIDLRDATRRELFDTLGSPSDARSYLWSFLDPNGVSQVVVYYSGHGVPGLKDKRGYLLPVDTDPKAAEEDGYPIDLLYRNLAELGEVRSAQVFLDACFSGGSHKGGLIGSASPVYVTATLPEGTVDKVTSLTAATGQQIASWDEKARHGMFTHHLLDALYGRADANNDGRVTAAEAKEYLDQHMTRAARRLHRRVQDASLMGADSTVLVSATEGKGFPDRPTLDRVVSADERNVVPPAPENTVVLDRGAMRLVQRGLTALMFYTGPIDGVFGPKTRTAIQAWQEAKGYDGTGNLTHDQADALAALGKESESERPESEPAQREVLVQERTQGSKEKTESQWRPGTVLRDCDQCPEIVVVPPGSFLMGESANTHRVTIPKAFAVGKYEVTFEEWDACVALGGCRGYRPKDRGWGRGRRPVIYVSWEDARAYVRWLSTRTGKNYRLLSEAEWEYAARAGTTGPFHVGSRITPNEANYDSIVSVGKRSQRVYRRRTVNVGSFPANGYGLHDVHGNIWEWVEDCWHDNFRGAPDRGDAWASSGNCSERVLRGGSWDVQDWDIRSAARVSTSVDYRSNEVGFRVARTLIR